jgi:hypothetical protein
MPARISCPHCGQDLRLPDHLYDGPAQCPYCDGPFAIRWRKPSQPGTAPAPPASTERGRVCRFCGAALPADAVKCPGCGETLRAG